MGINDNNKELHECPNQDNQENPNEIVRQPIMDLFSLSGEMLEEYPEFKKYDGMQTGVESDERTIVQRIYLHNNKIENAREIENLLNELESLNDPTFENFIEKEKNRLNEALLLEKLGSDLQKEHKQENIVNILREIMLNNRKITTILDNGENLTPQHIIIIEELEELINNNENLLNKINELKNPIFSEFLNLYSENLNNLKNRFKKEIKPIGFEFNLKK